MDEKQKRVLIGTSDKRNALCIAIITLVMLVLIIRSFFSFCQSDESLYIAFAHRFFMGDKPIIDEWHPVQFYVFILYPFYWIYKNIVPGVEGVFLFFRILQKLMAYGISLFSYKQLKKMAGNHYIALFCTLAYQLYLQANIEGMSYYNIYISMLVLTVFMMFAAFYETRKKLIGFYYFASGITISFAVLSCPYLAIGVILAIIILFICLKEKRRQLLLLAGAVVIVAASYILLFLPKDISSVINSLMYILNDPEHTENAVMSLVSAIKEGFTTYHLLQLTVTVISGCILLFIKYVLKKNLSNKLLDLYMIACLILVIPPQFFYVFSRVNGFNYFAVTISAFSIFVIAIIKKINIRQEVIIYMTGMLAAGFSAMASNTRSSALTSGLVLSVIAVILGAYKVIKDVSEYEPADSLIKADDVNKKTVFIKLCKGTCIVSLFLVLGCIFINRIWIVYRDDDLNKLNTLIESGPAKGLFTTAEHKDMYDQVCNAFDEINKEYGMEIQDKNIFISKLLPWGYLCFDCKAGAYSCWRIDISSERLMDYYEEMPEKIPDIVVILRDDVGAYKGENRHNENDLSGRFWDYIQNNYTEDKNYEVASVWYKDKVK